MGQISYGEAVGEGFALVRRQPLAVLAWGAIPLLIAAAGVALFAPLYAAMIEELIRSSQSGGAPNAMAWTPQAMQAQGMSYLLSLGSMFINAALICAVTRAVLYPERKSWAYLRIGGPELFVFVLFFAAYIALIIGMVVAMIPIMIFVAILMGAHAVAAAVIVAVIGGVAVLAGVFYLALRFSMVAPMMVDDGQFHLMESWTLTKGHAGSLFAIGVTVVLMVMAIEIVVYGVVFAAGAVMLSNAAGGMQGVPALLKEPPGVLLGKFAPLIALYVVVSVPLAGLVLSVMTAPWARAYRQLKPSGDIATTFA